MNGDIFRALVVSGVETFDKQVAMFVDLLTSGAAPPGTVPIVDEGREYLRLVELRDSQDPIYTTSPEAQRRLAELEARYGSLRPQLVPPGVGPGVTSVQPPQVPTYMTGTGNIARGG